MTSSSSRSLVVAGAAAAVALAAISVIAIAAASGGFHHSRFSRSGVSCAVPNLGGTVVDVTLTNMGGPMMGQGASMRGGMMRLTIDRATVPHGTVSLLALNAGSINHELVVLPLADAQIVGTRPLGGDARIDESGSLGEASNTCAAGSGDGIAPGASSWTAVTLQPGRYELVCNLPGHYAAGMYSQLTVT
jgi:uncharacterized cupredoxin-like copper-binding protein